MVTKYNTGQAILVPAKISSAEERDGKIIYHVDAELWEGIPEDAVVVDENATKAEAMKIFMDSLLGRSGI